MEAHNLDKVSNPLRNLLARCRPPLFLTFGEQGLLAVKNRDLDEIRKKVGRRSEERRDTPRA
jgi:hypothetical protein